MKKFLLQLITFFTLAFAAFSPFSIVFAQGYGLQTTGQAVGYETSASGNSVESIVNKIVSAALIILAIVFFGLTLFAGIRWMTARGNEEMITKSKETLIAAIIGLAIVSASYALTKFIFTRLGQ